MIAVPGCSKNDSLNAQLASRTVRDQQEKRTCVWLSRQPLKIEQLRTETAASAGDLWRADAAKGVKSERNQPFGRMGIGRMIKRAGEAAGLPTRSMSTKDHPFGST